MTPEYLRGFWIIWLIFGFLFGLLAIMAPRMRGLAASALITMAFTLLAPAEQIELIGQIMLFIVLAISLVILDKTVSEKFQENNTQNLAKPQSLKAAPEPAPEADLPALKPDKPVGPAGDELL